jgi:hypothetical protein
VRLAFSCRGRSFRPLLGRPAARLDALRDLEAGRLAGHGGLAEAEGVEDLVDHHALGNARLTELDLRERLADEDAAHAPGSRRARSVLRHRACDEPALLALEAREGSGAGVVEIRFGAAWPGLPFRRW